jgi:putative aldouronate transport system permease protein
VSVPAPFILAMLMNELSHRVFKRTVQTISYLPHFISWVTIAALIYVFLSTDTSGILNNLREMFGAKNRILFMKYPKNFPVVLSLSTMYKEMGWGSIIYLAAIAALDAELYEAAAIDGAGRWKQFVHITFPGVLPTTMILIIFAMAGLLSTNFDQVFNLQNDIIIIDTNTINVYTYRTGVMGRRYSIATAVGLFQGAVNCVMLLSANWISRRLTSYGLF